MDNIRWDEMDCRTRCIGCYSTIPKDTGLILIDTHRLCITCALEVHKVMDKERWKGK